MNMPVYLPNDRVQSDSASGTKRLSLLPGTSAILLHGGDRPRPFQYTGTEERPFGGVIRLSATAFAPEAKLRMWLARLEVPLRWRQQGAPQLRSAARDQAMAFATRVLRLCDLSPRIEATTDGGIILSYSRESPSSARPMELFIECDGDGETVAAIQNGGEIVFSAELESLQDVDRVVRQFISRASS